MAQFGLLYVGEPQFKSEEEGKDNYQRYMAWMQNLGDALVEKGIPMGPPTRVSAEGVSDAARADRLTGLSIVEAEDMAAAIKIAQDCPYIEVAAIDVVRIFQMG